MNTFTIRRPSGEPCEAQLYADYGPLVVTGNVNGGTTYVVTHRASTVAVRNFKKLSEAKAAAKEWALLPVWNFRSHKPPKRTVAVIKAQLEATRHWENAV